MLSGQHWARTFSIQSHDVEHIMNRLLETETPTSSAKLAQVIIEYRLKREKAQLEEKYKDTSVYIPRETYEVGQKLIFAQMDYESAVVTDIRKGENEKYPNFDVVTVVFDDDNLNLSDRQREFAAGLDIEHKLNTDEDPSQYLPGANNLTVEDILEADGDSIIRDINQHLNSSDDLVQLAGKWFPRDLMLDVDIGHLHLAEAVLDMHGGGPLQTQNILEEIGGLGNFAEALQIFSLNYALNEDERFDEVGSSGEILWFLKRLEPETVLHIPSNLLYTPIDYQTSLLTDEMLELEYEIGDELSIQKHERESLEETTVSIIYPHRRSGTLPLNANVQAIFPTARTPRIAVTLVDAQDSEVFPGWVVHQQRFIYGLEPYYMKHHLPVGAYVMVRHGNEDNTYEIDFDNHRPRTEWIPLMNVRNDQLTFENSRRSIGAGYDDLLILGVDEIDAVDQLAAQTQKQQKSIVAILKAIIPELCKLTPQATVHAKTLYSAVNVLRRCPPGPIFATLIANPDFENVGGHYWQLSQ